MVWKTTLKAIWGRFEVLPKCSREGLDDYFKGNWGYFLPQNFHSSSGRDPLAAQEQRVDESSKPRSAQGHDLMSRELKLWSAAGRPAAAQVIHSFSRRFKDMLA